MNLPFALGTFLIGLSASTVMYSNTDILEKEQCVENWIRDILCITTTTVGLLTIITTIITYYVLVATGKSIPDPQSLLVLATAIVCYCSWDLLTRNEFVAERKTIKILVYIFIFIVLVELATKN